MLPVDSPHRQYIFNIYGTAGVGKTYLTKQLRQIALDRGALTAYADDAAADPLSVMSVIADEFAEREYDSAILRSVLLRTDNAVMN